MTGSNAQFATLSIVLWVIYLVWEPRWLLCTLDPMEIFRCYLDNISYHQKLIKIFCALLLINIKIDRSYLIHLVFLLVLYHIMTYNIPQKVCFSKRFCIPFQNTFTIITALIGAQNTSEANNFNYPNAISCFFFKFTRNFFSCMISGCSLFLLLKSKMSLRFFKSSPISLLYTLQKQPSISM